MTKMKKYVRILKAPYRSIWYANQIGSIFPSLGAWENAYKVNSPDRALYIRQEDGELIVTEKRPAKRHDRILITNAAMHGLYKNGDEFVVDMEYTFGNGVSVYAEYDIHRLWGYYVTYSEYEVIVNNEEADGMEIVEKRYDTAVETARDAVEELRLAAYAKGFEDARRELTEAAPVEKTAQERRDGIVEQAKADVEKLSNRHQRRQYCGYSVEFRVNNEKRTIVVLLKGVNTGIVYTRGIAKAAPDDCFNEHIGKAIALHRALGLEVPDEYLNAPQPTEVRVGDVVMHTATSEIAPVISDDDWPPLTGAYVYQRDVEAARRYALIIDDSRTEAI
ncbi:hypothetical protein CHCC20333_4648 [Bacillus paralicheniformis]|uniref:hypothetical protein n=1 Tax=Bacillus paralicheniformis TaxID=1648923 RepID=UPI0011BE863E|nr:hypothetical protein [Bacillus paralicheniformis]TWK86245.1 hypothetical protein CHCC20333_4648 [Bacillus paralicheniformis]